jgi:biopolymer transport protein TolR
MGQLVARVRQLQTDGTEGGTPVIISADKNVKYDVVMKVMGELQAKGIARVGLAVQAAR